MRQRTLQIRYDKTLHSGVMLPGSKIGERWTNSLAIILEAGYGVTVVAAVQTDQLFACLDVRCKRHIARIAPYIFERVFSVRAQKSARQAISFRLSANFGIKVVADIFCGFSIHEKSHCRDTLLPIPSRELCLGAGVRFLPWSWQQRQPRFSKSSFPRATVKGVAWVTSP